MATGRALAEVARLVVADIDADGDVRREADEPGVLFVVGGAGLAGDRLADFLEDGCGTSLHHALHHGGDLIGRHGVEHLLAAIDELWLVLVLPAAGRVAAAAFALVVLEDGVAVAILDAIYQRRLHATSAIGEH